MGGIGVRSCTGLCYSAYLSSYQACHPLIERILHNSISQFENAFYDQVKDYWLNMTSSVELPTSFQQKAFDYPVCKNILNDIIDNSTSPIERARLLASSEKESGAWLQALPSNTIGTLLDDNCFRISFATRYGLNVITPHTFVCGQPVNSTGLHGLSCYKSAGRRVRHVKINDLLKRHW